MESWLEGEGDRHCVHLITNWRVSLHHWLLTHAAFLIKDHRHRWFLWKEQILSNKKVIDFLKSWWVMQTWRTIIKIPRINVKIYARQSLWGVSIEDTWHVGPDRKRAHNLKGNHGEDDDSFPFISSSQCSSGWNKNLIILPSLTPCWSNSYLFNLIQWVLWKVQGSCAEAPKTGSSLEFQFMHFKRLFFMERVSKR